MRRGEQGRIQQKVRGRGIDPPALRKFLIILFYYCFAPIFHVPVAKELAGIPGGGLGNLGNRRGLDKISLP